MASAFFGTFESDMWIQIFELRHRTVSDSNKHGRSSCSLKMYGFGTSEEQERNNVEIKNLKKKISIFESKFIFSNRNYNRIENMRGRFAGFLPGGC